jgi:hypothetical protein
MKLVFSVEILIKIGCTEKAKPLYEKNNFQSSGQHLFCRGKKEF